MKTLFDRIWEILVLLFICWLLFIAFTSRARAAELSPFAEIGVSSYVKPPNKLWWQSGYENSFENHAPAFRLGGELGGRNFATRASYFDLGGYTLSALATTDEPCYIAHGASPLCGNVEHYVTQGAWRGFALTGIGCTSGDVQFCLEAGATFYRASFDLFTADGGHAAQHAWGPGWTAGAQVRFDKRLALAFSVYDGNVGSFPDDDYPSGIGRAWMFGAVGVF